jgi:myosin V
MANNYEVGTAAWQPDSTEGWVASEVKEKNVDGDKVTLVFALENGEVCYSQGALEGQLNYRMG